MLNGSSKDAKPLPWKMNESHITFQNQTIVNVVSTQLNSTDWDFLTAVACCVEFKVIFAKILLFYSYPHQRKHPFCKFMSHNFMLASKCNFILKKDPWFFKTEKDVEKIKYDLWIYKLLYCEILPTANFLKFRKKSWQML